MFSLFIFSSPKYHIYAVYGVNCLAVTPAFHGGSECEGARNYKASQPSIHTLPSFDLPLWDSTSPVLGEAQGQHSEEDVEGVGGAVELGVSWRVEGRGGAAAAGLLQQSQGRLTQGAHARHPEPGDSEGSTLGGWRDTM